MIECSLIKKQVPIKNHFAISKVSCFCDYELHGSSFVHLLKFSIEKLRLHKAAKPYDNFMRLFIACIFLVLSNKSFAQWLEHGLSNNDPYKIVVRTELELFKKEQILKHKISKISILYCLLDRKSKPIRGYHEDVTITFNHAGNPIKYEYICNYGKRRLIFFPYKKLNDDTIKYDFEYDSSNNLIHLSSQKKYGSYNFELKDDIFFFYDKNNRVVKEIIQDNILPIQNGLQTDNQNIIAESNSCELYINYNQDNKVSFVHEYHPPNSLCTAPSKFDSAEFNCPFDSIFESKTISLIYGISRDSLGKFIEPTNKKFSDTFVVGKAKPYRDKKTLDSLNRVIVEESYDDENRLQFSNIIDYTEEGFINSEKYKTLRDKRGAFYRYEKWKN